MDVTALINSMNECDRILAQNAYINHKQLTDVFAPLRDQLPNGIAAYLKLILKPRQLVMCFRARSMLNSIEDKRLAHNETFISTEMARLASFFDDVEGNSLDEQQRRTVLTDEDNSLVIAGAGSGKTLTIVAKVQYLLRVLGVPPQAILPISFTKKSAEDMKRRINVNGIHPQTFHKFGLTTLQNVEQRQPSIFDGNKSSVLLRESLKLLTQDHEYLTRLNDFFIHYIKIPKSEFDFESLGDYIQYLKDQNYTTYKKVEIPYQGKKTYRNEVVKSIQECIIANFLLFNRVPYAYEAAYALPVASFGKKSRYNPDFTLFVGDQQIYLEHFGIDREMNVPKFFAGPGETYIQAKNKYLSGIDWKRRTHNANGTSLLETYSYEFTEGTLEENLKAKLEQAGVTLDPMTQEEMWEVIQESAKDEVDAFVSLVDTFLALMKSNNYTLEEIASRNAAVGIDVFLKKRGERFLELFAPLYEMYEEHLVQNEQIDFSDMINRATQYIENGNYHCPLQYVIVDEFQDLSVGRYKILEAIRKQNPNVKFYCVGDDWQSIFRFAGSDIALFRDFEAYFGYTATSKIETTYRFNEPLISASSEFILKNPNQTSKTLRAPLDKPPTGYSIIESNGDDDSKAFMDAIGRLAREGLKPDDEVYIIGRYNFDLKRLRDLPSLMKVNLAAGSVRCLIPVGKYKGKVVTATFQTAHRSKGLEADYTVLLNCNSGKYGFPSGKADDPLLNLLLSSADQFENGEERRLFYVALTRTKKHAVLITDKYRKSKFIKELQDDNGGRETSCPRCKQGELVLRSGKGYRFYGCSNFAFGCTYSQRQAPISSRNEIAPVESAVVEAEDDLFDEAEIAPTPPKSEFGHASVPAFKTTNLTKSELNRLDAFLAKPQAYAISRKAREKVIDLDIIRHKFNTEQKTRFDRARSIWKANLRP